MCIEQIQFHHILRGSFSFGFFQFFMPLLGFWVGSKFEWILSPVDHWVAFLLLTAIGGKMILEARTSTAEEHCEDPEETTGPPTVSTMDIRNGRTLLLLSLATSIDALTIGITFRLLGHSILGSVLTIGCITFLVCVIGFEFGKRMGHLVEQWAERLGGVILIGIGGKILLEHLIG
ncbi:MAG: hypothetical protein Kow009_14000 [Spirochaetales bacterium]